MNRDKLIKLEQKIREFANKATIEQIQEVNDLRGEHAIRAQSLAEEYMQKEMEIYKRNRLISNKSNKNNMEEVKDLETEILDDEKVIEEAKEEEEIDEDEDDEEDDEDEEE